MTSRVRRHGIHGFIRQLLLYLTLANSMKAGLCRMWLFMPAEETLRLIGINASIQYMYKDDIYTSAINATVVIKANISNHVLRWVNLDPNEQVTYQVRFIPDYPESIQPIKINISESGVVPTVVQAISMNFECTGTRPAVDIAVKFSFTRANTHKDIILRRKKICQTSEAGTRKRPKQDVINYNLDSNLDGLPHSGSADTPTSSNLPRATSTEIFYVAVGVASTVIILIALIIFVLYIRTKKQVEITHDRPSIIGSSNHGSSFVQADSQNKNWSSMSLPTSRRGTLSSYSQLVPVQDVEYVLSSIAINRKSITLGTILLEGAFGRVQQGVVYVQDESEQCYEQRVLVKAVNESASGEQRQTFLKEGSLLKGLSHQYINPVIAACVDGLPLLVYPFCEKGNLKMLLNKSRQTSGQYYMLSTQALVAMAIQTAKGLHYLHRKHIVHKDVATRNCFVDANLDVKIADYSFSRDLFPNDYCCLGDNQNKPVKWMAIESLVENRFSYSTDTWSYGVFVWELVTHAQQPYADVDDYEMSSYLLSGYRLLQPKSCPDELFAVMAYCWAMHAADRPSLSHIITCLKEFHKTLSCFV